MEQEDLSKCSSIILFLFVWHRHQSISPHNNTSAVASQLAASTALSLTMQAIGANAMNTKSIKFIVRRIHSHRKLFEREKTRKKKRIFPFGLEWEFNIKSWMEFHTILSHHQIDGNDYVLFYQLVGRCACWKGTCWMYVCFDAWSEPFEALLFSFHFIIP